MDFTPLARKFLVRQSVRAIQAATDAEAAQMRQLRWLVGRGRRTLWGEQHGLDRVTTYDDFANAMDVNQYEHFRPLCMRMVAGERDILWPGLTRRFAQSSGTSGGKSKYIPVTDDSLRVNHYPGASSAVAHYLRLYPDSRMFAGKGFILGGSFANEIHPSRALVGDLSANLIDAVNPVVNLFRVPKKSVALMESWEDKLPALVEASVNQNVTNISGVPSWFLTVLKRVIERAGATTIHDVWPNLEVFFHGGISFKPYRGEYAKITDPRMRYIETYNASEGFFAAQSDINDPAMLLLADAGVFYEFVPLDQVDEPRPQALPLWRVEPGKTYALVITACNGLWRYAIGDTVRIESINPVKITIAGRTKHYINAFGEELMVYNADAALARACAAHHCTVYNYTAAPVYTEGSRKGRHQWLVEWLTPPADTEAFADTLDQCLQQENSDYQAKRQGGIFLDRLELTTAPAGLFDRWLASTGKLGGQRKIPRLSNDRAVIDNMLSQMRNEK